MRIINKHKIVTSMEYEEKLVLIFFAIWIIGIIIFFANKEYREMGAKTYFQFILFISILITVMFSILVVWLNGGH